MTTAIKPLKTIIAQKHNGKKYIPTTHKKFIEERLGVDVVKGYIQKDFKRYADPKSGYIRLTYDDKSVMVRHGGELVAFTSAKEAFCHHIYQCWLRAGERQCLAGV
jgi:hypothetical protein